MFDKVKLSNFEKMEKVQYLMTYNFLTAGFQNVLLLLAVVEELSSPTFTSFFFLKICVKDS